MVVLTFLYLMRQFPTSSNQWRNISVVWLIKKQKQKQKKNKTKKTKQNKTKTKQKNKNKNKQKTKTKTKNKNSCGSITVAKYL